MKASNKRIAEFRIVMDKLVSMLSERSVRVTQQGVRAFVLYNDDGSIDRVNIPFIPDDADDSALDAIRGYVDHEVGHVLFTDPADSPRYLFPSRSKDDLEKIHGLSNVIEDTRVEREMQTRFPGTAGNLSHTFRVVTEKVIKPGIVEMIDSGCSPLPMLVMPMFRAWAGQLEAQRFMDEVGGEALIPAEVKLLEPFKSRIQKVASTREASELANEILQALKDAAMSPPPLESSPSSEGDPDSEGKENGKKSDKSSGSKDKDKEKKDREKKGKGKQDEQSEDEASEDEQSEDAGSADSDSPEQDKGEDEAEGKSGKDKGEEEDSEGDSEGDSEDDSGKGSKSDAGAGGDDQAEPDAEDESGQAEGDMTGESHVQIDRMIKDLHDIKDMATGMGDLIAEMIKKGIVDATYLPFTTDHDRFAPVHVNRSVAKVDAEIQRMDNDMRSLLGQLQAQMRRMFAQQSQSFNYGGQRRGRLQASALHRLNTGDDRVFSRRETHDAQDTAVQLVIDLSGSMTAGHPKTKICIACETAYALTQVLERLGVKNEVLGFTTADIKWSDDDWERFHQQQDELDRGFSRIDPIIIHEFKSFEERLNQVVKRRLAATSVCENYQLLSDVQPMANVDGESILMCVRRLLPRREARKIMIVLSDGSPAGTGFGFDSHLKDSVKAIENMGVEMVGIGIADRSVEKFYPKCVVVNSPGDLPGVVMQQLKRILIQKQPAT